jgi:hypothetical protein
VKWQAPAGQGFDAQSFAIDWEQERASCPEGHSSISWTPAIDNRHTAVFKGKFSIKDCQPCPSRNQCIRSRQRYQRRTMTIRPKDALLALSAQRERERTPAYAAEDERRVGIEATISQCVRSLRLRRSRYFGAARTHLSHVLTVAGLDVMRVADWLAGIPQAGTRHSHVALLMAGLAGT